MSDQGTMFDQSTDEVQQPTNESNVPEFLAEYVGDDKKYKSVEDALQSVPNAQAHIDKLEQELAELRGNNRNMEQLESDIEKKLLERMAEATPSKPDVPAVEPQQYADPAPVIEVDDVATKVKSMLDQEQTEKLQMQQQKSVVQAAIGAWGSDAERTLYSKAKEFGMSPQEIDAMSATNPKAALKILGIESVKPVSNYTGALNTQAPQHNSQLVKPTPPENWGNDSELVPYIKALAEYEAAGGKL